MSDTDPHDTGYGSPYWSNEKDEHGDRPPIDTSSVYGHKSYGYVEQRIADSGEDYFVLHVRQYDDELIYLLITDQIGSMYRKVEDFDEDHYDPDALNIEKIIPFPGGNKYAGIKYNDVLPYQAFISFIPPPGVLIERQLNILAAWMEGYEAGVGDGMSMRKRNPDIV